MNIDTSLVSESSKDLHREPMVSGGEGGVLVTGAVTDAVTDAVADAGVVTRNPEEVVGARLLLNAEGDAGAEEEGEDERELPGNSCFRMFRAREIGFRDSAATAGALSGADTVSGLGDRAGEGEAEAEAGGEAAGDGTLEANGFEFEVGSTWRDSILWLRFSTDATSSPTGALATVLAPVKADAVEWASSVAGIEGR